MSSNAELATELEAVKEALAPQPDVTQHVLLESAFVQLVRLHIVFTPVRAVTCNFHFPDGYPTTASLSVSIASNALDAEVLSKLEQGADREAQAHLGKPQILLVVRWLEKFLAMNRLLACYSEVRQLKALLGEGAASDLKLTEKAGKITVALHQDAYAVQLQVVVPDNYPAESPKLTILHSNFTKKLTNMFEVQAKALIVRMHDGYSASAAHMEENNALRPSDKLLEKMGKKGELLAKKIGKIDLSTAGLRELKSDTKFLSKVSQVRDYSDRGTKRILVHKQKMSDKQKAEEKAAQAASLEKSHEPRPCVYEVIAFIAHQWVWRIPKEVCPLCTNLILPEQPAMGSAYPVSESGGTSEASESLALSSHRAEARDVVRVYCTHWYHYACLDPYMTTPPFDKRCPVAGCDRLIFHPLWTSNKQLLEKRWSYEQAKEREMAEVAEFLGVAADSTSREKRDKLDKRGSKELSSNANLDEFEAMGLS